MNQQRSSWAVGYAAFAAIMLMMAGTFHVLVGLAGALEDEFYAQVGNWLFEFDSTTWGWIHILWGVLVFVAGLSILKGHMYGRIMGTIAAAASAVAAFAWLPYGNWWAVLIIALDISIIWALTVHGRDITIQE